MRQVMRACLMAFSISAVALPHFLAAQSPDAAATAALREIRADGEKILTESQIAALTAMQIGSQVGRSDLQTGADKLVASGLFAKVSYNFTTKNAGVVVTFHVEESPRIPAYFDNIPWFADSELGEAIRKKLPFFDGTLPEGGAVVDQAAEAVTELLSSRGLKVALEHMVLPNPISEGNVQSFHIEGAALRIAKLDFSDPSLLGSKAVQQHLTEILGKPYSRMAIELFLSEQIRPIYEQLGFLRAKLGPPEVRLTGDPNKNLPDDIPVFVPIASGAVYRWKSSQWTGNTILSSITMDSFIGLKPGDVANGMQLEGGLEHIREEYGHHGYLDVKLDPSPQFDEQAHTVSYNVNIQEGVPYKFGRMVITGLSPAAERRILQVWTVTSGELFDKTKYEELLTNLQTHPAKVFGELPLHYESVGHWLQTEATRGTVDILLDFK
jgi:outer membrane protein assembly factor BamA